MVWGRRGGSTGAGLGKEGWDEGSGGGGGLGRRGGMRVVWGEGEWE